jgi:molybdenum cofactor cytidylyltransferase
LLDATLVRVREAGVDQVVLALGGAASDIPRRVDLSGVDVVVNPDFGDGCSTSVRSALGAVRADADGVVLVLGDPPGIRTGTIHALLERGDHDVAVCAYDDGPGHPLWFHRRTFGRLRAMHGDKAVWKLVGDAADVVHVPVPGPVPLDVDTWEDYQVLLAEAAAP